MTENNKPQSDADDEQRKGRRRFFVQILGSVVTAGVLASFGITWTILKAVDESKANSALLACPNQIKYAIRSVNSHWLNCIQEGVPTWHCRFPEE